MRLNAYLLCTTAKEAVLGKRLKVMVARDGIEPPTPVFSGLDSATAILLTAHCLALAAALVPVRFIGTIMEPKFRLAGTPRFQVHCDSQSG